MAWPLAGPRYSNTAVTLDTGCLAAMLPGEGCPIDSTFSRREVLVRIAGTLPMLAIAPAALSPRQPERSIPPGTVTLDDFEAIARSRLDPQTFEILRGGAADE